MALTYVKIASVTVGAGGASSIDFTSIPNTYTDLCLKISLRSATGDGDSSHTVGLTFNGVSTNRNARNLSAYGTTVYSDTGTAIIAGFMNGLGGTANTYNNCEIYIPNYTGSTNKSISLDKVNESNTSSGNSLSLTAGLWSNSAAINQITLTPDAGNFTQYSSATLYGILKA